MLEAFDKVFSPDAERKGMKSLQKRVASGELIVTKMEKK